MRQSKVTDRVPRVGFTLIELLVVMAIIAILAALGVTAYLKVRESSQKSQTQTTITKLASVLDVQWKAALDQAGEDWQALEEEIKNNYRDMARGTTPGPDPKLEDRARLLYKKVRLKQEFPTSFRRAVFPGYPGDVQPPPSPPIPTYLKVTKQVGRLRFNGRRSYIDQFTDSMGNVITVKPELESSICLYVALSQSRRTGNSSDLAQAVGAASIQTVSVPVVGEKAPRIFSYFVDSWGYPLQFYIFPTSQTVSTLDLVKTASEQDPQDPTSLLFSPWQPQTRYAPILRTLLHPMPYELQAPRKLVPVIVSMGSDNKLGGPYPPQDPSMNLASEDANDNIYSHRLRQTDARGD